MRDPFLAAPLIVTKATQPIANALNLQTLPLHVHEIVLAFSFYQSINLLVSPAISTWLFPNVYHHLPKRTRINWDVHFVSLVQSSLITLLALWVIRTDQERRDMDWTGRVWGYTGATGMIQGFSAGYFLWDLMMSTRHVSVLGWGSLAHAVSALIVSTLGFRPFVNYYGLNFALYALSTPFLNVHWFLDKINMTGSRIQLYNGILLLTTFGSCRLVWGVYQSLRMYRDVCTALQTPDTVDNLAYDVLFSVCERIPDQTSEALHSSHGQTVPIWLACAYLGSNTMLSILNFYWFGKMIEAVSKRFKSPKEKTGQKKTKADGRISSVNTKTREEIELDGNYRATPRGNALRRDVNKSVTLRNSAPSIHS